MSRVTDLRPWINAGVIQPGDHGDWEPGDWVADAVCSQTDPEVFYPEKGGTANPARRICDRCPAKAWCLAYAVVVDDRFGVWGGTTTKERDRLTSLAVPGQPEVVVRLGGRQVGRPSHVDPLDRLVARKTEAGMTAEEIAAEVGTTSRSVQRSRARSREAAQAAA